MKKKALLTLVISVILILSCSVNAFAGQWLADSVGWWWRNDDGSYPANCWQWLDGNNDGIAECYYFNPQGYCLLGTVTPDGYTVDPTGAWIVGKDVQRQAVPRQGSPAKTTTASKGRVNLASLQVTTQVNARIRDAAETMYDGSYGKCIDSNSSKTSYVEFYTGGKYDTLHLSYAPKKGFTESSVYVVEVYGDDVEQDNLFCSDDITYRSHSQNEDIDISGCEFIRIKFSYAGGGYTSVLAKGTVE